jgi:glycosyltransferase involved in cell wall biosynthesis
LSRHGVNQTTIEILGPLLEQENYSVVYASSQKNQYIRMLDMLYHVFKFRKSNYAIIDTYSTSGFWYAFATSQLCRLLSLKYIPILHGGNLPQRILKNPKASGMIFKYSYLNISPSIYLLEKFNLAGYTNVIYIPNVIEIKNYPFKKRTNSYPKLLWVRSFSKIYNPTMAIDVLKELQKKLPQATLCMVGPENDGSLAITKNRSHSLGLDVRFTGKLSKKEWITLSQEYTVFINTTHFDNMPISVIEAMSLGLGIVSTNVGGIPFLLDNNTNAFLINDGDVIDMVNKIQDLLNSSALFEKFTHNAREKAESFDWKCVREKWFSILQ